DARDPPRDVLGRRLRPAVLRLELLVALLELAARNPGQRAQRLVGALELRLRLLLALARILDTVDEQLALRVAEDLHRAVVHRAARGERRRHEEDGEESGGDGPRLPDLHGASMIPRRDPTCRLRAAGCAAAGR